MSFVQKMERAVRDLERCFSTESLEKLREEAQHIYTGIDFVAFKGKYSLLQVQAAFSRQIVRVIDRQLRYADLGKKEDLYSLILMDEKQGINKALSSFDPEKASLSCKLCEESSSVIIDSNDFYVKNGKKYHKVDDGELVCKSLNSWIVDFIYYPTKGPDKDAMKRSRYREYNCPKCGTPVLEKTRNKEEELTCEDCFSLFGEVTLFKKSNELKSRKSYYHTEVFSISNPLGGDVDGPTLDEMLFDNSNDAEEALLRSRANHLIDKLEKLIAQWVPRKSGIFKDNDSLKESEVFRLLIPEDFLFSDHEVMKMSVAEFQKKVPKSTKALGIMIAGKAGRIYPYSVCQDCGKKYDLGKNWEKNFQMLQLQGCTSEAIEHRSNWTDQVYDKARALNDVTYQHRIGYERALEAGSNSDVFCDFKEDKTVKHVSVGVNYEERRLLGLNLELHSYTNGFSDIGDANIIPLPSGYLGKKEHIDLYLFQAANRWMGKLRTNCPNCKKEIDELNEAQEAGTPKGEFACPHCDYKWKLREGDFLQRIKTSPRTGRLYQELMDTLRQILKLRVASKDPIICVSHGSR